MTRIGTSPYWSRCYFCGDVATTEEHAPAKVFFPEVKDFPEYRDSDFTFRRNLLVVPSCTQHNCAYSKDDELVAYQLLTVIHDHPIAARQFETKAWRALNRPSSSAFQTAFLKTFEIRSLGVGDVNTGVIRFDRVRFDSVMTRIARALYYRRMGEPLAIVDGVWSPDFRLADTLRPSSDDLRMEERVDELSWSMGWFGHPSVFQYQAHVDHPSGGVLFKLLFYDHFRVRIVGGRRPASSPWVPRMPGIDDLCGAPCEPL